MKMLGNLLFVIWVHSSWAAEQDSIKSKEFNFPVYKFKVHCRNIENCQIQDIDVKQQHVTMTGQRTLAENGRKWREAFFFWFELWLVKIWARPTSLQCHRTGCPGRPCTRTSSGYLNFFWKLATSNFFLSRHFHDIHLKLIQCIKKILIKSFWTN